MATRAEQAFIFGLFQGKSLPGARTPTYVVTQHSPNPEIHEGAQGAHFHKTTLRRSEESGLIY